MSTLESRLCPNCHTLMQTMEHHDGKTEWRLVFFCPTCQRFDTIVWNLTQSQSIAAKEFFNKMNSLAQQVRNTSLSILVWGPKIDTEEFETDPYKKLRSQILDMLNSAGFFAVTSESLNTMTSGLVPRDSNLYDKELLQASAADCIVDVATSPSSIGEATLYSRESDLLRKMIILAPSASKGGFLAEGWYNIISEHIIYFNDNDIKTGKILNRLFEKITRIQWAKFYRDHGIEPVLA